MGFSNLHMFIPLRNLALKNPKNLEGSNFLLLYHWLVLQFFCAKHSYGLLKSLHFNTSTKFNYLWNLWILSGLEFLSLHHLLFLQFQDGYVTQTKNHVNFYLYSLPVSKIQHTRTLYFMLNDITCFSWANLIENIWAKITQ